MPKVERSVGSTAQSRECTHGTWGPNISKSVRDRGLDTMGHQ